LLEVSRITRGKIELKTRRVELADVLSHAVETAQPMIDRGNHELRVDLPSEPVALDADPVRLAQVFTNLLNNAAKYTEQGGVIELGAALHGAEAVVTVRDSGVGIPAEMLPRVFDLFTQVDRSLGRAQGGLGIGLALVKSLLQLHGGSVEAQSEGLGRGSAFIVRLPTNPPQRAETPMAATSWDDKRATRRILVIDDDHDVADSLVMFLETFGAEVRVAYSGADGVEGVKDFTPELVFLDLGMPGMDGYETARRIRALPEGRDVKLVALTGWGQDQIRDRAREAGFDSQLTKPAGLEALQELLDSL
jgi:CheY-like chemotaxis protein